MKRVIRELSNRARAAAAILAGLILAASLFCASPAAAGFVPVAAPVAEPPETGVPVYPLARDVVQIAPSSDQLRSMLRLIGPQNTAAIRGLRGVLFRVPAPVNVPALMRWYATTESPPPGPGLPLSPTARIGSAGRGSMQSVAGPRSMAVPSQTGMRPLATDAGYLVVSVAPYPGRPGDARVTVVRVEGSPAIVKLLEEIADLVGRNADRPRVGIGVAGAEALAFPGSAVARDILLPQEDVPLLLGQIQARRFPPPVQEMYSAILRSAQSIRLTTFNLARPITADEFLRFYRALADRMQWGEVTNDVSDPRGPMVVFSLGDGSGIVMVRSQPASSARTLGPNLYQPNPAVSVTILIVEGKLDVKALRAK